MHKSQDPGRMCLEQKGFIDITFVEDPANKIYSYHAHHEAAVYIMNGMMRLGQGGAKPRILTSGDLATIKEAAMHVAVTGFHGCKYLVGVKPDAEESWNAANS